MSVLVAKNPSKITLKFENGRNDLGNTIIVSKTFDRVDPFEVKEGEPKLTAIYEFAQLVKDATTYQDLVEVQVGTSNTITL